MVVQSRTSNFKCLVSSPVLSLAPRMPQKGDLDILSNYFIYLMYVYLSPTGQTIAKINLFVLRMSFHSRRHVEHGRAFNS